MSKGSRLRREKAMRRMPDEVTAWLEQHVLFLAGELSQENMTMKPPAFYLKPEVQKILKELYPRRIELHIYTDPASEHNGCDACMGVYERAIDPSYHEWFTVQCIEAEKSHALECECMFCETEPVFIAKMDRDDAWGMDV